MVHNYAHDAKKVGFQLGEGPSVSCSFDMGTSNKRGAFLLRSGEKLRQSPAWKFPQAMEEHHSATSLLPHTEQPLLHSQMSLA